uniref:SET domain-containing protein n=1 Tax=Physcomitrium patens TaxID=3218 RepID=A0A7I4F6F9_PHYPA
MRVEGIMHPHYRKGSAPLGGTELGREILMQLGTLQLYGMDPQLTPLERGLVKYSLRMDKAGLMEAHMRFLKQFGELERDWQLTKEAAAMMTTSKGVAMEKERPPVRKKAVEGMRAIHLVDLAVGKRNHGRVLYATICADTFFLSLIQTLVEDDEGLAARVMIDDATLDGSASWAKVQRRYPRGAKIAIKAPFLSDLPDESIALYVTSEEDLVVLSDSSPSTVEFDSYGIMDAATLRTEGNRLFAKQDWPGAIGFYTKCIQKAMSTNQRKPNAKNRKKGHSENGATSNGKVSTETVVLAYSNRAAAWMKLCHYERALVDAEEALHLDPQHLKSIYRKGCALRHMQQFQRASECFAMALEYSPEKEIRQAHNRSKTYDSQSRLVVNAEGRKIVTSSGRSNACLRDELVYKLSNLVLKSSRWLQQLCCLADCDCHGNGKVPSLELFRPNSKWNSCKDDVPLVRMKGVVLQNALDESGSCTRGLAAGQQPPARQFLGLWPLASFINHSCASNSFRLHVGDTLFLHASRPIEAGEEVTLAYVNTLLPRQMRQELLDQNSWEFKCNCSRCLLEAKLSAPLKQLLLLVMECRYTLPVTGSRNLKKRGQVLQSSMMHISELCVFVDVYMANRSLKF